MREAEGWVEDVWIKLCILVLHMRALVSRIFLCHQRGLEPRNHRPSPPNGLRVRLPVPGHGAPRMGEHGAPRIGEHGTLMMGQHEKPRMGQHGALRMGEHGVLIMDEHGVPKG